MDFSLSFIKHLFNYGAQSSAANIWRRKIKTGVENNPELKKDHCGAIETGIGTKQNSPSE